MLKPVRKWYWGVYAAGAGIAANSFSAMTNGCTGSCGNCQLSCIWGICTGGFMLAGYLVKKICKQRDNKNAE